uniref:Ovule protein n=1 Tax=Syphacia muris TaxID=451379 RepID=A0A0N5AKR6_9BILA
MRERVETGVTKTERRNRENARWQMMYGDGELMKKYSSVLNLKFQSDNNQQYGFGLSRRTCLCVRVIRLVEVCWNAAADVLCLLAMTSLI